MNCRYSNVCFIVKLAIALQAFFLLSACSLLKDITSVEDVKPWQRGTLARDDMQLIRDPLHQNVDDHIYFSKEGSIGGSTVRGGGCGCN